MSYAQNGTFPLYSGENVISNSLLLALVKKKQHKYKKRIAHINEYISKSWYLFEKIRSDGVISLQEVNEFRVLIEQYEQGLTVDNGSVNVDNDKFSDIKSFLRKYYDFVNPTNSVKPSSLQVVNKSLLKNLA